MDSFVLKTSTSEKKRKVSQLNSNKDSTPNSKGFNKSLDENSNNINGSTIKSYISSTTRTPLQNITTDLSSENSGKKQKTENGFRQTQMDENGIHKEEGTFYGGLAKQKKNQVNGTPKTKTSSTSHFQFSLDSPPKKIIIL